MAIAAAETTGPSKANHVDSFFFRRWLTVGEKSCGVGKHGNVLALFHVIDHPQLSGAAVNEWLKVDLKAAIHVKAGKDSALTNVDVNC